MSNPSNLYAEKVFAEHPMALWSLDEAVDYISLIDEETRVLFDPMTLQGKNPTPFNNVDWTFGISNPSPEEKFGVQFPNSNCSKINPSTDDDNLIDTISFFLNDPSDATPIASLDKSLDTFNISFFLKSLHPFTSSIEIGYFVATDPDFLSDLTFVAKEAFSKNIFNEWSMYSATFDVPNTDEEFLYPYISISYINQTVAGGSFVPSEYSYVINGISMGQWSEGFTVESLGIESPLALTESESDLFGAEYYVPGYQYGLGSLDAKYLISDNSLLCKNTSVPMVYGSKSITRISPNSQNAKPSLVIPGAAMLYDSGRYNEYTFETWLRIDVRSTESRRILGPVGSEHGLYVEGPFLRVRIGDSVGSYFVGEWYRPMLVDLRIAYNSASLLVNGEEVINVSFDTETLELSDVDGEDFWGFYAYQDVPIVEIDCPAIYSYVVPSLVAKRRFGYGQAVESPDGINKSFGATTAFIDYSVADYTGNYHYPDMGRWSQGISENIDSSGKTLSSPAVALPEFIFSSTTYEEWFSSQKENDEEYFTFADSPGFIRFNDLSVTSEPTKGIYKIFSISSYSNDPQILFKVVNKINGDEFRIVLVGDTVDYILKIRGVESIVDQKQGVLLNSKTFVGISFDRLSDFYGGDVLSFFNNSSQLLFFISGDNTYSSSFTGKVYKVGICTERNLSKIIDQFEIQDIPDYVDAGLSGTLVWFMTLDGGFPDSFDITNIYEHVATYTLRSHIDYGVYSIDVDCDSYWQDYVPLAYFAQYVKNINEEDYYDLDFLQFNIDYPTIPKFRLSTYDTRDAMVKTYISFQIVETGATKQLSSFAEIIPASRSGIVNAGNYNWMDAAFEVVDGMIIYPPKDIPLTSYAIVTHVDMKASGAIKNKIAIRKLQYASQAYNDNTANPIGTKFNVPVFPYQKLGVYFDYKSRNPYRIYKGSTPYLYLTRKSGIEKVGDYDPLINRGFLVNINSKSAPSYKVIATQMFAFFGEDEFPKGELKFFELESDYSYIKVFMQPIGKSRKRARLYAFDAKTGEFQTGLAFYINGKLVKNPIINVNEWTVIGMRFAEPLRFDNSVGAIRITGPLMVNNISYYESSGTQEVERQSFRLWFDVAAISNTWDYWRLRINEIGGSYLWSDVLVLGTTQYYGVDPSDIYKAYTGTNKIIAGDKSSIFLGGLIKYGITKDIVWSSNIIKPL
jgi:hypothetical protein